MSRPAAYLPRWVAGAFAALAVWLTLYELHAVLAVRIGAHGLFDKHVHLVILLSAAGLIFRRAKTERRERLAWFLIGAGVLAWELGEVYYTLALWDLPTIPIPSGADAGYLAFPVFTFVGMCLLARSRVRGTVASLWADGLAAALAVGAVSAAFVLDEVLRNTSGRPLEVVTNLAYPVTDLVLLGTCVAIIALRGWRVDRTWALLGSGVLAFWIADSLYLVETALGTYTPGGVFDIGWWLGLVLIALAAWQPAPVEVVRGDRERGWMIALPIGFGALAAGVLAYGCFRRDPLNAGAVGLSLAALGAVAMRLVITSRAFVLMLKEVRAESLTDPLTGLPNRRAFARALEEDTFAVTGPMALALYDLDGFKHYNDTHGHPAGDALLARRGQALLAALDGRGVAYRMGGDEFCVVIRKVLTAAHPVLVAAAHALCEHGEGFAVTSTWGAVSLLDEATSVEEALQIADQRMYDQKHGGRLSRAPTVRGLHHPLRPGDRDPDGLPREGQSVSLPPAA
jgi:two-component system, cell cycle response regulator